MGKTATCIKMLRYLNTGKIYKVSELAGLLETNARNIIEYKNELEEAGYFIESIPGRHGGYRLNKSGLFPVVRLTEKEKDAISEGFKYLTSRNDFLNKTEYMSAIGKVMSSISQSNDIGDMTIINRFPLSMSESELKSRYDLLNECIHRKVAVKFTYISLKNKEKEYMLQPYELFMYNNAWFVIGWLDEADRAAYFKLNRILEIKLTDKKFMIRRAYKRSDYLDENGFKNNGEWYHIEFEAYNQYAMLVRERIYGRNQVVTPINEHTTKVSVDMQNKENIFVFILGFGENVKILEPEWLKEEVRERHRKAREG